MQTLFVYAPEELPPIPQSLYEEYSTYGGGAYISQDYDGEYEPKSYFAEIQSRAAGVARRAIGMAKRRLSRDH